MPTAHNGVTAHRGNSVDFPENTLAAFADGIACGADWLELDVHQTHDGHLVVCHDETSGRTGDADLHLATHPLARLRGVDVAVAHRRSHPGQWVPFAAMPLLSEVLGLVLREAQARLSIQPKSDCVAAVVELVKTMGAEEWVGFNDGNLTTLRTARELLPAATIFYDTGPGGPPFAEHIATARRYRFDAIVMHQSTMTPEAAQAITAAGFEPGVWTVNEPNAMRRFLALGVRRIYTDCPRRLLDVIAAQRRA